MSKMSKLAIGMLNYTQRIKIVAMTFALSFLCLNYQINGIKFSISKMVCRVLWD